ncbi:hypothetical protein HJC23_006920 [Cyclotella cryptica]|uniref:Uncharacterized protein n=1 Tax=Cyclotella cryptica TaxID=29204 RepID=A0ABD3QCR1_9STRA|eukprot:CCRYP_006760-RA/>CCRYP_006760-RA protein AED:0.47 eAED:0.47 QI:0/-1/0/1/-1/1/1/0/114
MKSTVLSFLAFLGLTSAQLVAEWGRSSQNKRTRNHRSLQASMSMDFSMSMPAEEMSMSAPSFIPPVDEPVETGMGSMGEQADGEPIVASVKSSAAGVAVSGAVAACAAGAWALL